MPDNTQGVTNFATLVIQGIAAVGSRDAPAIADWMFPRYYKAIEKASADAGVTWPRNGLREAVQKILTRIPHSHVEGKPLPDQFSLFSIHPDLFSWVEPLQNEAYYVPSEGCDKTIQELVADIGWLDETRLHLRTIGKRVLLRADQLDNLAEEVRRRTASGLPVLEEHTITTADLE